MQVIILNSGVGLRLLPYTKSKPKCLLKINNKSILEYQMDLLISQDLRKFIITTGPFENQIKELISSRYPNLEVTFVNNSKFESTNYIYSIWLAKDQIDEDILLLHGDLIFDPILLSRLLEKKNGNYVPVNNLITPPEKDFKAEIKDSYVSKISVNLFGNNVFFLAPIYLLSKTSFSEWLSMMETFIETGNVKCYAEDALNEILDLIKLKPLYFKDEICMEIDSEEDLNKAKELLNK